MSHAAISSIAVSPFYCNICLDEHPAGTSSIGHIAVAAVEGRQEVIHRFCIEQINAFRISQITFQNQSETFKCPIYRVDINTQLPEQSIDADLIPEDADQTSLDWDATSPSLSANFDAPLLSMDAALTSIEKMRENLPLFPSMFNTDAEAPQSPTVSHAPFIL
jgi:hypothetical protein